MPVFDTLRINHAHLGKVMVERTKIDHFNDMAPKSVKSTKDNNRISYHAWRKYIRQTLKEKSLTSCAIEHIFA